MLDIKWIRDYPQELDENLARRGLAPLSSKILELDEKRRNLQTQVQELQNKRNQIAKEIGQAKAQKDEAKATALSLDATQIKEKLPQLEEEEAEVATDLMYILETIPNNPLKDVPLGTSEADNVLVNSWGTPTSFSFTPKAHYELGENLGLMSFDLAAKMSGARFVLLRGDLARLERALSLFMLDIHTREFGYEEISPPLLVKDNAFYGAGLLPKFADNAFQTTEEHWLIPTAEVSLTNIVRESILDEDQLPMRFVAHTPCFRSEAGAAGKDTRGMIRQHQFYKVELVSIIHPDKAIEEHERMTSCAMTILERLNLPFRRMLLCSGDMGVQSQKTYDLEVWLPSEQTYREISSCSTCGDYQARRMDARFKDNDKDAKAKTRYVGTLNGSGLAVGRTLIAVMENYQQADGSIAIPDALVPYMGGLKAIKTPSKAA